MKQQIDYTFCEHFSIEDVKLAENSILSLLHLAEQHIVPDIS